MSDAILVSPAQQDISTEKDEEAAEPRPKQDTTPNYSVFTRNQKKAIIFSASWASFFSPLTANIYLPALNTIAKDLDVSNSKVNLTITIYSIFQGIAPTFIASVSDVYGRRPIYIACFALYIICNIALGLQTSYAALMVLRAFQSSTISGTVSNTSATGADIVTSAERGTYVGYTMYGSIFGPSLSPVIGGLLSQYLGWQAIFYFLAILAFAYLAPLIIFLPETCRNVVGDGSLPPPWYCRSLYQHLKQRRTTKTDPASPTPHTKNNMTPSRRRRPSPRASLRILFSRTGSIPLLTIGLLYAAFYIVITSIPSQFSAVYGYNNVQLSLLYIPTGAGSLLSAFTTGPALNWNFHRHAHRLGIRVDRNKQGDLAAFPIERARLEVGFVPLVAGVGAVVGFGWAVQARAHVACPVVLMFVAGWGLISGFQCMSALLIDVHGRRNAASASAANNLVRCTLAAVASAVVGPLIEAVGVGWACTIGGGVWLVVCPVLLGVLAVKGMRWRERERLGEEENERTAEARKRGKNPKEAEGKDQPVEERNES